MLTINGGGRNEEDQKQGKDRTPIDETTKGMIRQFATAKYCNVHHRQSWKKNPKSNRERLLAFAIKNEFHASIGSVPLYPTTEFPLSKHA